MELFQFYRFQKYKKFLQKNCFLIFWHTEWRPVYVQRCCRRQHSMSASFFTDFIKWSNAWNSVLQLIFSFVLTVATDICKRFSRAWSLWEADLQNTKIHHIYWVHSNTLHRITMPPKPNYLPVPTCMIKLVTIDCLKNNWIL